MIGVIGVGGAGGSVAHEANELGILSGAINYSSKDLEAIDVKHKLKLAGSEGVGKDREVAASLFAEQWETATRFVQERFSNVDAIIIAFSSSGGSGAGISPLLLDILSNLMPDKVFSAFVVIPDLSEVTVSQANCLQVFEELSKLNCSIFPIDNQQAKNRVIGKNRIYEYTNKESIRLLHKIASYTEKHSKTGNFDKKDFLSVLGTKGIATMSEVAIADCKEFDALNPQWVAKQFRDSLTQSVFTPVEFNKVSRAAVIFDGQESIMQHLDHETMFNCFSNGLPLHLYEGYSHDENGRLYTMLTGLSWCNKRLDDIQESMLVDKERIESVMASNITFHSKTSDILSKLQGKKQPEKKQSVTDILNKYKR